MSRIRIEDLPVKEEMSEKELKGVFGGIITPTSLGGISSEFKGTYNKLNEVKVTYNKRFEIGLANPAPQIWKVQKNNLLWVSKGN